jgi:hypothetical protein
MFIGQMVSSYAEALRSSVATVAKFAQLLRQDGLLSTGARGVNAPHMTTLDGARLLIALLATDRPAAASSAVRAVGNLPGLRWGMSMSREISGNFETELAEVLSFVGHEASLDRGLLSRRSVTVNPSRLRAEIETPVGAGDLRFSFERGEAESWDALLSDENLKAVMAGGGAPVIPKVPIERTKGLSFTGVGEAIEVQRAISFPTVLAIARLFAADVSEEEAA